MVAPPAADLVALVRSLHIDQREIRQVIERLTAIGSSPLGYRTTGTPEDVAVAEVAVEEMTGAGLVDVAVEPVSVDAWHFRSAGVALAGDGHALPASSFGGVPGTPPGGITARLADVGDPRRTRLDRLDLSGCLVLVDWLSKRVGPSVFALELARRGALGMVVCCPPGGAWYQGDGALGAFDAQWPPGGPPMVMIAQRDAARIRERCSDGAVEVTMTLDVEVSRRAVGRNVVGFLPGDEPGPVVVGAHHDAWFRGAFDNTSGVAAMIALAGGLTAAEYRPRHTICFTSRTGEEFGLLESPYDWCVGAWEQVATVHPEWGDDSPFHLCVEASGHPALRTIVEAPVEYRAWARRVCRVAQSEGWTPTGWRVAPPVAGTEQWPFLLAGVPGVAAYAWETSFADTDYHTQLDTAETVDCAIVADQARLYALLVLDADRRPDDIADHRARARQLARTASATAHDGLAAAARQHATARGRAAFTAVGRGLHALDAQARVVLPHEQALRDVTALDAAIAALDRDDRVAAARLCRKVGSNQLHPYVSKEALQSHLDTFRPEALERSWGAASHLTETPNLWSEITALRGEGGTRPDDGWVRDSLERARTQARHELDARLDSMARCIAANPTPEDAP